MPPRRVRPRLLALAALAAALPARAQSPRVVRSETNFWLNAPADVWFTPTLGLQGELLYERAEMAHDLMQIEARLGVQHMLHSGARIAVGGTFVHNNPYGPFPAKAPFDEGRLWEQLQLEHRAGVVALAHRYRLEQRWIERPNAAPDGGSDMAFTDRFRYQLRATVPLTPATVAHPAYVGASDEIFLSFGSHAPLNLLDQNRAYVGAGVRWSPRVRAELGYLNQAILRSDGKQLENNHTVQVTLAFTRPAPKRR